MRTTYEKYDLKEVINASGKMTALGVSKYPEEALEAQRFGGTHFFEMDQLFFQVEKYLADLLEVEGACIVSSASAGIALTVAGIIGKGSLYHLHHPYSEKILRREIIVPKGHNVDYGAPIETMIQVGGGQVVEAGYANKCDKSLIQEMISDQTAAILFVKSHHSVQKSMLSVEEAVEVAHENNLPLIIDAAAEEDLKKYVQLGADVVIYSGAKAIGGTTSGLVIGKADITEWTSLQSNGIGRAMKIGKENVLGLAAAVETYLLNGTESGEEMQKRLKPFIKSLNSILGINASLVQDAAGRDIYRAKVELDHRSVLSAKELEKELQNGNPAIYVRNHQVNNGILEFDIRSVNEQEMDKIIKRIENIMTKNN